MRFPDQVNHFENHQGLDVFRIPDMAETGAGKIAVDEELEGEPVVEAGDGVVDRLGDIAIRGIAAKGLEDMLGDAADVDRMEVALDIDDYCHDKLLNVAVLAQRFPYNTKICLSIRHR